MMEHEREKLTLEERIARAARSQAASPEAAAGLVRRLAQTHTALVFAGSPDLILMNGLLEEFIESLEEDLMHYSGFCRSFQMAINSDLLLLPQTKQAAIYAPVLGTRVNNAVVLLGLMLLDHARGRRRDKNVYHCTRMNLGQYLDALETLAFPENEALGLDFRHWREPLLKTHDLSAPLAEVLADELRRYIAGWRVLGRLDHILDCMDGLSSYLQKEQAVKLNWILHESMCQTIANMGVENVEVVDEDEQEHYSDPHGHFLGLALAYSADVPDPGAEDTAVRAVREQIFLSRWDYSPQTLEELAGEAPSPEFRALLEEQIDPERLCEAMAEINTAVAGLYMLWVAPYLRMEEHPQ